MAYYLITSDDLDGVQYLSDFNVGMVRQGVLVANHYIEQTAKFTSVDISIFA
jgi:hypothetical protein